MRRRQDFTGERFGRLLVIGVEITPNGHTRQICQCDCGKIIKVLTYTLKSNEKNRRTRSCGCLSADLARERAKGNTWNKVRWANQTRACQPGDQYGQLSVLAENGLLYGRRAMLCRCSCGKEVTLTAKDLISGNNISCGCARRVRLDAGLHRMHGHWEARKPSPEYSSWNGAKNRCYNQHDKSYDYYGGRGIKMCDRWKDSFEAFLQDMGPRPAPAYTLDRTNNDGDYEPGNCRWADKTQQTLNRRAFATQEQKLERLKKKRDRYIALVQTMEGQLGVITPLANYCQSGAERLSPGAGLSPLQKRPVLPLDPP